jgi:c-di-GMP-binding flagellar brake protein YcgR
MRRCPRGEETVAIRERRKGPRFDVRQPVHFTKKDRKKDGRSLNISLDGIKIETDGEVRPDDVLDLTLLVGESLVKAKARVVYVEELPDGTFHAGLVFEDISETGREALVRYLSDILDYGTERRGILKKTE